MKRLIYDQLLEWKNTDQGRHAVLIEGARRVGKSYITNDFGNDNYASYLTIDFSATTDEIRDLFYNYLDHLDDFFHLLTNYYQVKLFHRQSLIIFDEVQHFPRAREAIKRLVADGRYDYIETGSLISIKQNVKDILIPSEERKLTMRPMNFQEFCLATNNQMLWEYICDCFAQKKSLTPPMHRRAMNVFRQYLIVGGLPQAVAAFIKSQDYTLVDHEKRAILDLYRNDISKFSDSIRFKVEKIFDDIPSQLQRHEKKFNLADIDYNARLREYDDAFYWLLDAGLINIAYNTTEPNLGLNLAKDDRYFKCYLFDTGLLLAMTFNEKEIAREEIYKKILFNKLEFNQGMIMEHLIAQMLRSSGHHLFFYVKHDRGDNNENMEVDFLLSKNVITNKHNIIPIEVKTGVRYTYKSLRKFSQKYQQFVTKPIIIHQNDLQIDNGILYLPAYMAELL